VPTVITFLSRYIGASTATSREAQIIYTIWTESLHGYDLLRFKPSVIASSVIWLGRYSQIIEQKKEEIVRYVDDIQKNTGVNRIGVVREKEIKIEMAVKNNIPGKIVEDIISEKDLLLEQLSIRTNGYPWTSTLTHITGIFMSTSIFNLCIFFTFV
jgi:Cyclin, C-terminal domain